MSSQSIQAQRITKDQNGEIHFVIVPKDEKPSCSVAGTIDDDGNLKDVHCVNDSCKGECELHEEKEGTTIHYYCTCEPPA